MKFHFPLVSLVVVVVAIAAAYFTSRSALAVVVRAGQFRSGLKGLPVPYLKAVQSADTFSAYAVVLELTHEERTILTPLADQDPRLRWSK